MFLKNYITNTVDACSYNKHSKKMILFFSEFEAHLVYVHFKIKNHQECPTEPRAVIRSARRSRSAERGRA